MDDHPFGTWDDVRKRGPDMVARRAKAIRRARRKDVALDVALGGFITFCAAVLVAFLVGFFWLLYAAIAYLSRH